MLNTKNKRLNAVLIGTGMVAQTHLSALSELSTSVCLQGVLSKSQSNANRFAEHASKLLGYPVEAYSSIEQLCENKQIDFAIVVTPPNARAHLTQMLATHGVHILMEKPIERNSVAALDIVELCEQHTIKLGIVFQHRMREASQKLTQVLSTGTLGPIHIAEVVVPWWRDQSYYDEPGRGSYERDGGGVLISQAIHTLELMLSYTGPVSSVQAMASCSTFHQMEAEDYVSAGLRFEHGAIGSLIASTASYPGEAEQIKLHCEHAAATLGSGILTLQWRNGEVEQFGEQASTGGGADPMAFTHHWHKAIIENFTTAIKNNTDPIVTGRTALGVQRLIDGLMESSRVNALVHL